MKSLPIVCSVLLVCGVFTTNGESVTTTPNVVIDGYTVNSTLNSTATLTLGTTVILVCRLSGIPHGLQINYHWTCPNGPCQQTGYAGRKINNNTIAINITSTSDGGTYTCNVTAEGREATQQFQLKVTGGRVVHSYGRLILNERVITDKQQLQPPNNDSGDGRIECTNSSGGTRFNYHGGTVSPGTSGDVYQIISGSTATVVIRDRAFNNFVNFEGDCAGIFHYLFLSNGTLPNACITGTPSADTSITVNIGTIANGIGRVIIGYHRLDLGVPVVGEYGNNEMRSSGTFSSLVPGAKYRITAWGLGGGGDRNRSQSPAVTEVTTMEQFPSPPRDLTITRVCDDGIELNWIPPREPKGDIQRYIIKYTTQDGTRQEINTTNDITYYNLTGLERGQNYNNITVLGVNSAGGGGGSQPITSYVHNPTVESTMLPRTPTPSPATSTTAEQPHTPTSPPTPPTPATATIAGAMVGVVVVVLLTVLLVVVIIVVLVVRHRKRANNSKAAAYGKADQHVTLQDTKPDTVYYSAVGKTPGDGDGDEDGSIVGDNTGPLYADANEKKTLSKYDSLGIHSQEYDVTVNVKQNTTQAGVNTSGLGPISAGYDDLDSVCTNTIASNGRGIKKEEITGVGLDIHVYALPDKSKKKNKGKKKDNKEQEMGHTGGPTCDPLFSTEAKEDEPPTDPEQLYTAVDMTKKKKDA